MGISTEPNGDGLGVARYGWTTGAAERAIGSRADRIADLVARRVFAITEVQHALRPLNNWSDRDEGEHS